MSTTLANTVVALETTPSNAFGKNSINTIVEEIVTKGTTIVRNKMSTMKMRLTSQAKKFTTYGVIYGYLVNELMILI